MTENTRTGYLDSYGSFAKLLRTWFVIYGVGGPILIVSQQSVWQKLQDTPSSNLIASLFLIGVASQVMYVMLHKWTQWELYYAEENKNREQHQNYKIAFSLSENYIIDLIADIVSFLCFSFGTFLLIVALTSKAAGAMPPATDAPQSAFFSALRAECGKAYAGRLVSTDAADAGMASQRLVMHVRECADDVIRVPFHVGDDRSRTWVISKTGAGLRLKHDHRHEDGSEDAVTQYGGDTASEGSATRQEFPVDAYSVDLFTREGLTASVANVWAVEVKPGEMFAYELSREGRFFRAEFDLSATVEAPPPPWGRN